MSPKPRTGDCELSQSGLADPAPASPFIFMLHIEHMEEFYFSDGILDERKLREIKDAIPGCDFGFTGLKTQRGVQYKLVFSGDSIPSLGQAALRKYGMHK
jgi:hypothetical protein